MTIVQALPQDARCEIPTTDDDDDRMRRRRGETASTEGCGEPGRDYDPSRQEPADEETGPAGQPVTHGTPLAPDEYARLKERARRGGPEDRSVPAQRDR